MSITLADAFRQEAEAFLLKTARENGLGFGTDGTHLTERHGVAPALTIFGWCGKVTVAVIFGQPDTLRPIGRAYLLWCVGPMTLDVSPSNLPPALGEVVATDPDDLRRMVSRGLAWLRCHTLEEAGASFMQEGMIADVKPRGAA